MPHVTVKLWPGNSETQKSELAKRITEAITTALGCGEDSVSVSMEEVSSSDWKDQVYDVDIHNGPGKLYKQPGYRM